MNPTRQFARPGLDLIEEAVHLLRRTPAADYLVWFAGAGPFAAAVLYFWADMSRAALAEDRLLLSALGLAALFLWLKTCQAVFAARLLARAAETEDAPWTLRRWLRVFVTQAAWQPSGLLLLPPALLITLPFGWVFSFYQSVTVLGDRAGRPGECFRQARRQGSLWPGQNHAVLSLLSVVWLVAMLNAAIALFTLPQLGKMLLGIESRFTLNPWTLVNTTFLATVVALGGLITDPLTKAVYALRCFHGASLASGDDLRARLRRLQSGAVLAALLFLAGFAGFAPSARAQGWEPPPAEGPSVAELDEVIDEVLRGPEYTWRAPREWQLPKPQLEMSWLRRTLERLGDAVKAGLKKLERPIQGFANWLDRLLRGRTGPTGPKLDFKLSFAGFVEFLLWLLVVVVAGLLVWLGVKLWRRRNAVTVDETPGAAIPPDLRAEFVAADQLPEDGWLALANELMSQGDHRLALRAFYLAALAHLARREFIRLARFKSNRDYENELRRRARSLPSLLVAFAGAGREFDRAWYGGREVTAEGLAAFAARVEQVRAA